MRRWSFTAKLEPRDAWVGLFWDRRGDGFHVYVCPVPFVVFHAHRRHTGHPIADEMLRRLHELQRSGGWR